MNLNKGKENLLYASNEIQRKAAINSPFIPNILYEKNFRSKNFNNLTNGLHSTKNKQREENYIKSIIFLYIILAFRL